MPSELNVTVCAGSVRAGHDEDAVLCNECLGCQLLVSLRSADALTHSLATSQHNLAVYQGAYDVLRRLVRRVQETSSNGDTALKIAALRREAQLALGTTLRLLAAESSEVNNTDPEAQVQSEYRTLLGQEIDHRSELIALYEDFLGKINNLMRVSESNEILSRRAADLSAVSNFRPDNLLAPVAGRALVENYREACANFRSVLDALLRRQSDQRRFSPNSESNEILSRRAADLSAVWNFRPDTVEPGVGVDGSDEGLEYDLVTAVSNAASSLSTAISVTSNATSTLGRVSTVNADDISVAVSSTLASYGITNMSSNDIRMLGRSERPNFDDEPTSDDWYRPPGAKVFPPAPHKHSGAVLPGEEE